MFGTTQHKLECVLARRQFNTRLCLARTEVKMVLILRNGIVGVQRFIHVDKQMMVAAICKIIIGMGHAHVAETEAAPECAFYALVGATRSIGRTEPLRYDALATERASLTVDDRTIRDEVRVERDARMLAAQQRLQGALAGFDWLAPQFFAVEFQRSKAHKPAAAPARAGG